MKHFLAIVCAVMAVSLFAQETTEAGYSNILVRKKDPISELWGYVNLEGAPVINSLYEWIGSFEEDLAPFTVQGKWGFVNREGVEVVPAHYDQVHYFSEGLALVSYNNKMGFIDKNGNEVIPLIYNYVPEAFGAKGQNDPFSYYTSKGTAMCTRDRFGVEMLTDPAPMWEVGHALVAWQFREDRCRVKKNGKFGYINKAGATVIDFKYKDAGNFSDGVAPVRLGNKWGYIDTEGNQVMPFVFDDAWDFTEGLAVVRKGDRYGYVNKKGELKIAFAYEDARSFSDGMAKILKKGKWGFINSSGQGIIPADYDYATQFSQGIAEVQQNGKYFCINKKGQKFDDAIKPTVLADHFITRRSGKLGMVNKKGEVMVPFEYNTVDDTYLAATEAILDRQLAALKAEQEGAVKASNQPEEAPVAQNPDETVEAKIISDVDINIPKGDIVNSSTFVVIIANEHYSNGIAPVDFAINDGETFSKYCVNTLGIPEKNIRFAKDATLNNIRSELRRLKGIALAHKEEAKVIFFYAGHGMPDEHDFSAYLLPVDGIANDTESAYSIDRLYELLGILPVSSVTVFMDACFSGSQRGDGMLASARGTAIKPRSSEPTGKVVVFSASQGDETAQPYREQGHGMFTYFLLKKLQQSEGNITLSELSDFVIDNVRKETSVEGKLQTPCVIPSAEIDTDWETWRLK